MKRRVIKILRNAPANSIDYKNALKEATNEEIKSVLSLMGKKVGCKGKISACNKELRKRGCDDFEKGI